MQLSPNLYNVIGVMTIADHFSECVEGHAFSTYDKFIKAEEGMI